MTAILFLVAALIFVLAAFGVTVSGLTLVPLGLAFLTAALLLDTVPVRTP